MNRIRHHRKRWRIRWPWRWLFPLPVDERFCPECRFPFHEGPLPREVAHFDSGSICAVVYPSGGFRRNEYVVKFGRWRTSGRSLYHSEFIPAQDLDDLIRVFSQLEVWLKESRPDAVRQVR